MQESAAYNIERRWPTNVNVVPSEVHPCAPPIRHQRQITTPNKPTYRGSRVGKRRYRDPSEEFLRSQTIDKVDLKRRGSARIPVSGFHLSFLFPRRCPQPVLYLDVLPIQVLSCIQLVFVSIRGVLGRLMADHFGRATLLLPC